MPIRKLQGLKGLKGLSSLSSEEQAAFMQANANVLNRYHNLRNRDKAANILYMNQKFIDRIGLQKFNEMNDGSEDSFNLRNQFLEDKIVGEEFDKIFKNAKDFDYNKYNQLSSDGKLKLMESNYLTPTEFEDSWQKHMKESAIEKSGTGNSPTKTLAMPAGLGLFRSINSMINAISEGRGISEAIGLFTPGGEEAAKKVELDKNQRILDNIYSEDADAAAKSLSSDVQQAYNEYATMSDNAVYKAFMQAITPGSYKDKNGIPNLGIADYKKYFGNGSENERKAPMLDFSIDDMRQVLAKKKVYDANMSPQMAAQALNNDAKRYATGHQNAFRKFGLFLKDVGISSLSYTADKVNGIYNLGLMAEDKLGDKPIVYVDDKGNVLDPNKTRFTKDRRGNLTYQGEDGNIHYVHRQQIDRTTLHNMGRNFDGSEDNSILNPQYWTRAEQFGTLDDDEQKQYEKLGASPYKVAYNPNEDSDLLYESFKMMSFGIADAASQLLPYGVGLFGKTLSTASKAGKIARGLGKALDTSGKLLTAESKVGQVAQGTAGALGIAYAYNRGAFQETLAQNLANAEEALVNTAKSDIYNRYQSDKQYKANVDRLVNARAASMKSEYLAQMRRDGGMRIADMKAVDKMIHAKAQDAVLGELVQNNINERKSSKEYADLQQKAIDGAGDAAFNTFLTEGLKYGFVNNLGYRKFLYTNPAGLSKKVSSSFKGLKEITTSEGKKRMATEGSKFLTRGQKLKEFGKTLGSQVWGGAWTNGTDDMQVDAAERINEDSFNKYLQAYQNGDALASTYGFADSLYSYVKGLQNSMGQETTWNSATVGGLGSVLSFTPNMTNIASLTTKEGREAYKNNFWREQKRDKDNYNKPILNEDGTPTFENKGRLNNWRGQINYLLQNGVLNTYYGKRQSERDLQNHADFVNNLLDEYRDFEDIEHLVASNMAAENYTNLGDLKTANYLKALHAINTLNNLGNDSKDPTTMSSVVQNAKALIDKAARFNDGNNDGSLNEEQISNVLSQYYASNPGLEQNEENNLKALEVIAKNAKELQKASKAFEDAGKEISKIESNIGTPIDPNIKLQLMLQKALVGHWQERKEKMQSEIEDSSPDDVSMDADTYIASVGGRKNAQTLVKAYNRQQRELEEELANVKKKTTNLQEEFDKATKEYKEAYTHGEWFTTDNATLELENKVKDARAKLDNSKMQEDYIEGMMARTANKRKSLEMDMSNMSIDETTRRVALAQEELARYQDKLKALREERKKYVNKNGERDKRYSPEKLADIDKSIADYEQNVASRKETLERNKEKVLTADEIFALDPITRARMMNEENRNLYTDEQKREIEKLEQKLRMKDADAIQKIQDIALLTQRINTNEDAYNRIASNPLAAAKAFEEQRLGASIEAAGIFNQRNAETLANNIKMVELASMLDGNTEEGFMEKYAYNLLRQHNHKLLDIMDEDNLLPDYQTELNKAKEWVKVTEDIDSVIYNSDKSEEWKKNIDNNISGILNNIDDKNSIIPTLEKIVDDTNGSEASQDIDYVLEGLRNLGYQRDSTILEERKQRKEREEADRKKKEEEAKKAEDDAKKAAEKKVEEESKKKEKPKESVAEPVGEADIEGADLEHLDLGMSNEELNAIPVDDGMEKEDYTSVNTKDTKEHNEKDVDIEGGNKETKTQTVEDEDLQQTPDGVIDGKLLMSDNYGNGSIGFGDMYYGKVGSAKKGNFMATRDGDNISFSIDGNKETLYIAPEDYEVVTDEQEKHKKELFIANSLEKIDGDWYFNGTFADDNKQTQVKASDKFDIDKAIEEQQSARKVAIADEVSTAPNVIDNGDSVQVVSETIEQQASDVASDDKEVAVSDVNEDMDDANAIGENAIENNITTLSGNAMSRYDMEPLVNDGRIVLKKGKDERRQMDDFYAWMKAEGINLQNIIDHELARIIRRNPHAKVRFLMTNPNLKVTNDDKVHTHLFLALDYDNSINKGITSIHNDENGGVLESDGKKYLVIGVAGYGGLQNKAQQSLYNRLFNTYKSSGPTGMLIHPRRDFFAGHPNDRFYVAKDYTTEIVPHSQIPGYIVRQSLKDDNVQYRSVKELLSDKERNPMGYEFNDLAWGIQELSQFLIIGASLDKVMVPRNIIGNLGSAFVLMPASNGKMVPSYLKVLKYTEMKDGVLKDRVNDLLNKVVAPDYNTRYAAALELSNIFYMEKEGDFILLRKNKGEISLTHNGEVQKTFVLDSNFDRIEFMKAFEDINPRVNITARVLTSKKLLSEYDEAGALQTDAAMFGTAGSSYSIYALDNEGKMIIPAKAESQAPKADDGEWRNTNRRQIIFKKQYYTYNPEESDAFYLNSKAVTDAREIQQLQYIRRVLDGDFLPATSKGVWDYYVLDSTDSSEVIKIDRNSKEVRELPEKEAKELIKKLEEEKARKAKEEKAKEIMNKATDEGKGIEDVSLEGESTYVNPETGEVVQRETEAPQADNEENTSSDKASEESTNKPPIASEGQVATKQSSDTQSLADLMGNSKYRVRLRKIIANKWKDAPKHPEELEKYLRGKNIDVDNIGTSKEDIESWIKTIEDCR